MALSTQPYKGARDFYPEEKRLQKYIFSVMRGCVEKFGYEEYDAPILEPLELYKAKTGEEIVNEQTYTFEDRGGRKVTLRPEMTPSVSRMVAAKRQELAYPLRWYSIPNLWRYERPQRGRLREHWQLNVDLFGISDLSAEHEIIQLSCDTLKAFGAKSEMFVIKLNSRLLMDEIMRGFLGLDHVQSQTISRLLDRMLKMDHAEFIADVDAIFTPSQREQDKDKAFLDLLKAKTLGELPDDILQTEPAKELQKLLGLLEQSGVKNAVFDITLMRGFDYYTDIVFEVFDTNPENNRSMFGGGRYDGLIGLFGVDPVPTVGFGMGDVTLANFLETHNLLPKLKPETDLYVILIGDIYEKSQKPVAELRKMGVNVAVDMSGRKVDAGIKTAVKKGYAYALFIGEQELTDQQYNLKNLDTGVEEKHGIERIASIVKDHRKK